MVNNLVKIQSFSSEQLNNNSKYLNSANNQNCSQIHSKNTSSKYSALEKAMASITDRKEKSLENLESKLNMGWFLKNL